MKQFVVGLTLIVSTLITASHNNALAASEAASMSFYTTGSDSYSMPLPEAKDAFTCEDQVYTVIRTENYPRTAHKIVVTWTDPLGKERERSSFDFNTRKGDSRVWSWLKLHRGTGGTVMSMFDSAAGLGEFIGKWTVEIAVDGKLKKTLHFDVLC